MQVKIETILSIDTHDFICAFGEYPSELSNSELFNLIMNAFYKPGTHSAYWYDTKELNTPRLGWEYIKDNETYLISNTATHMISVSRVLEYKAA